MSICTSSSPTQPLLMALLRQLSKLCKILRFHRNPFQGRQHAQKAIICKLLTGHGLNCCPRQVVTEQRGGNRPRGSQPSYTGPGYIHLGAEVLGRVRWGILEDLLQLIHIPKAKSRRVGGALAWAQRKREGSNYLPTQLTGSLSGKLCG